RAFHIIARTARSRVSHTTPPVLPTPRPPPSPLFPYTTLFRSPRRFVEEHVVVRIIGVPGDRRPVLEAGALQAREHLLVGGDVHRDVALAAVERAELAGVARLAGVGLALDRTCHGVPPELCGFTLGSGRRQPLASDEGASSGSRGAIAPRPGSATHCEGMDITRSTTTTDIGTAVDPSRAKA